MDNLQTGQVIAVEGYRLQAVHSSYAEKAPRCAAKWELGLDDTRITLVEQDKPLRLPAQVIWQLPHLMSTRFYYIGKVTQVGESGQVGENRNTILKLQTVDPLGDEIEVILWEEHAREAEEDRDNLNQRFLLVDYGKLKHYRGQHSISASASNNGATPSLISFRKADDKEAQAEWEELKRSDQVLLQLLPIVSPYFASPSTSPSMTPTASPVKRKRPEEGQEEVEPVAKRLCVTLDKLNEMIKNQNELLKLIVELLTTN